MAIGGAIYGLLAIWGVAKLISTNPLAMNALRVVGGTFLIYLCFSLWQGSNEALEGTNPSPAKNRPFSRGLLTQISNPKTMIIYVSVYGALLPQQPDAWLYLALPIAMFAIEALWYSFVSLALSTSGSRNLYLKGKKWFDRAAGAVLGLIGLSFIAGIWVK
jgi:threonine/homoserine/homoserine lactone efflux protein